MALLSLHDVPAPAKLNSFLHVIGRRADGYHLLQSAFVLIDWCDTLHFERRADGRLVRHDLTETLPEDDLCLRAARRLQEASGSAWGADIHIAKNVPWGAGLGGGSSDAASTLLALNRLWQLNWPRQRLLALAARLGADVPFFVGGGNAFVEGIGERLTPLSWPQRRYAVLKPPEGLPTPAIFGDPTLTRDTVPVIVAGLLAETQHPGARVVTVADLVAGFGRNDLEGPARRQCPAVAQAAGWLEQAYGNSRMTGSGSAVFARVGADVPPLATFPEAPLPTGWAGRMCRSLERHPLLEWAE